MPEIDIAFPYCLGKLIAGPFRRRIVAGRYWKIITEAPVRVHSECLTRDIFG
ncbi:MAG: hypothetical protein ABSH41_07300 [Syntrophobacteraceae bacterium]|jgi:GTP cyclohydrolase II